MNFVLVHGGGHGGWCYRWLARELRSAGHEVWAPTLTGFGDRSHLGGDGVTFETLVTDLVQVLELEDISEAVMVGHSLGGVVVPRVAEAVPERVRQVVWMAAVVLDDGETMVEAVPPTPAITRAVRVRADGSTRTDPELMLDAILSDGTLEQRAWVKQRHRRYPRAALVEPGRLTSFLSLGLETAYVAALHDAVIPYEMAQRFADRLPGCARADVDAGHDLMISQPAATARALEQVSTAEQAGKAR